MLVYESFLGQRHLPRDAGNLCQGPFQEGKPAQILL